MREQILGEEARARVPEQFRVRYPSPLTALQSPYIIDGIP